MNRPAMMAFVALCTLASTDAQSFTLNLGKIYERLKVLKSAHTSAQLSEVRALMTKNLGSSKVDLLPATDATVLTNSPLDYHARAYADDVLRRKKARGIELSKQTDKGAMSTEEALARRDHSWQNVTEVDEFGGFIPLRIQDPEDFLRYSRSLGEEMKDSYRWDAETGHVFYDDLSPLHHHPISSIVFRGGEDVLVWELIHVRVKAGKALDEKFVLSVATILEDHVSVARRSRLARMEKELNELHMESMKYRNSSRHQSPRTDGVSNIDKHVYPEDENLRIPHLDANLKPHLEQVVELIQEYASLTVANTSINANLRALEQLERADLIRLSGNPTKADGVGAVLPSIDLGRVKGK